MSNVGLWAGWHTSEQPKAFGNTASYQLGADWLKGLKVCDWGTGGGFFSRFIPPYLYRGVDGSPSPFADEIADLTDYRSESPGIFIRHVLEHNYEWEKILTNALQSFTKRMFLCLFTPLGDETKDIEFEDPPGVPNISFCLDDLADVIEREDVEYSVEFLGNSIPFGLSEPKKIGTETVFRMLR